jgi:hypothetical protein
MKPVALLHAHVVKLRAVYDGHTVELPTEDGVGLVTLYKRWRSAGRSSTFEVRDTTNRLIALGQRRKALKLML